MSLLEIDSFAFSELSKRFEEALAFSALSVKRVSTRLAPNKETGHRIPKTTVTDNCNSIIELFAPVGRAVVKHYILRKDPFQTRQ